MEELEKKWYVLRAIGGKEKKVKEFMITREMVENKDIAFALLEKAG